MSELPSGTVTFLFTDLEGSTRLWEEHPEAMQPALARHDEILRDAVVGHGGHVVKTTGDGIHAVFATARDAVDAAVAMQVGLADESFGGTGPLRVRMGGHTCEAEYRDGDYYGTEVNRAARLMSVAHGGQVVVSSVTGGLLRGHEVELVDLGEHRLRDLTSSERVFQVSAPGLVVEFPPLRSLDALPGNLPRQVTTFVGRETEITSIAKLVRASSLVTLTGVGGVGKTRLSLEVAAEVVPEFVGGAWFCELAPVADPGAVWETLAATLRVQSSTGRSLEESVLEYLALKRLLLVLDNCEHLLGAIARMVDAILRRCPQVSVLATSREGLGIGGEQMVAVPSLGVPAADAGVDELRHADAVRLFEDRASTAKVDFAVTDHNAGAVAVLCRRLDGIPLAIELAAARVRSMSPEDLVARLDQRFKLLTKGSRAALERQQTLRATIDWSYDLLDPTERLVLDRLSVFAGGCNLDAAEGVVAGDDLDAFEVDDVLGQLVDKSLVVADDTDQGVRYRLLETIRQYAQEQLEESGDTADVRRRHADFYVAVVETAGPHLWGIDQVEWIDALVPDVDNLRAALDWAIETVSPDRALRLVVPLTVDNELGDLAGDWAALAAATPGADQHRLFLDAAGWAAWGAMRAGDYARAEELLAGAEQVQDSLGASRAQVLRSRALLAAFAGDLDQSRHLAEAWVDAARASGNIVRLSNAAQFLYLMNDSTGRIDDANAAYEDAVRVARDAGSVTDLAQLMFLRARKLPPEEWEQALALIDEGLELGTRIRSALLIGSGAAGKAWIAVILRDWPLALETSLDSIDRFVGTGGVTLASAGVRIAGFTFCSLGSFEVAAVLFGRVSALAAGWFEPPWSRELFVAAETAIVEALGEERVAELMARGAAMEITDAVAYLRAEVERVLADEAT